MASGLITNPMTLLRVAPLVSSSFSLWFCIDQHIFFSNFINEKNRAKSAAILPSYWATFVKPGLVAIFGLYGVSIAAAVTNLYKGAAPSGWYKIGAAFSAAHFLFAPFIAPVIQAIVEDKSKGQSCTDMRRWLQIHDVRSLVVDLPGWLCYLAAVMEGMNAA